MAFNIKNLRKTVLYFTGMMIRIRSDPVIFGPPDPDPVLFSKDPDPTCNNGFIKLSLSWTKYISESTNSSIKSWVIISNFIPAYLKCKYIFFFISISGRIRSRIRSRIRIRNFFSAEPDPDPWKKIPDPHPWKKGKYRRPCTQSWVILFTKIRLDQRSWIDQCHHYYVHSNF